MPETRKQLLLHRILGEVSSDIPNMASHVMFAGRCVVFEGVGSKEVLNLT